MQKIVPFLWFDTQAGEAARFYETVFPNTRIKHVTTMENTPSGTVENIVMEIMGYEVQMMSAGPLFKINPSVSFSVNVKTNEEAKGIWDKLSVGGEILMAFDTYPWSQAYGWCNDKYGVSWQVIALNETPVLQTITPALMFTQDRAGKAEEAMEFYTSVFKNAKVDSIFRYVAGQEPDKEGTVAHSSLTLEGEQFIAFDSAREHAFTFNEGVSLMIYCADQAEMDYYWGKLSAVPEAEQCGWLKDKYGISWQVVPREMDAMMQSGDSEAIARVTQAFLPMKKLDLAALRAAYEGKG